MDAQTKPKRYLLFAGYDYYPRGGWNDLQGSFDTTEELRTFLATIERDWAHVVDLKDGYTEKLNRYF